MPPVKRRGRPRVQRAPRGSRPDGFVEVEVTDEFDHLKKATPSAQVAPLHKFSTKEIEDAELIIPTFLRRK